MVRRFSQPASSSSNSAATRAPSVRIAPAATAARARASEARASAANRDAKVGFGPSCAVPVPTRPAQYGWSVATQQESAQFRVAEGVGAVGGQGVDGAASGESGGHGRSRMEVGDDDDVRAR